MLYEEKNLSCVDGAQAVKNGGILAETYFSELLFVICGWNRVFMKLKCSWRKWDFLRAFRISYRFGCKIEFSVSFWPKIVIFDDFLTFEASAVSLAWLEAVISIFFLIAGVFRAFHQITSPTSDHLLWVKYSDSNCIRVLKKVVDRIAHLFWYTFLSQNVFVCICSAIVIRLTSLYSLQTSAIAEPFSFPNFPLSLIHIWRCRRRG